MLKRSPGYLQQNPSTCVYDGFEQPSLWGKDGTEIFHEVFAEKATYVVMFILRRIRQQGLDTA